MEELPEGWIKKYSKSKNRPYYYNINTKESVWEKPMSLFFYFKKLKNFL